MQVAKAIGSSTRNIQSVTYYDTIVKMTVKVYVWLGADNPLESIGHASMELGNGTYISLWPGDKMGKTMKRMNIEKGKRQQYAERSESLEEDIRKEGCKYDRLFMIEELDEGKIQRWWDDFETSWNLLEQNCCQTVIDGLRMGGSESKLNRLGRELIYLKTVGVWRPNTVVSYCEEICSSYYVVKRNPRNYSYETFLVHNRKPGFLPNFIYNGTVRQFVGVPAKKMQRHVDTDNAVQEDDDMRSRWTNVIRIRRDGNITTKDRHDFDWE